MLHPTIFNPLFLFSLLGLGRIRTQFDSINGVIFIFEHGIWRGFLFFRLENTCLHRLYFLMIEWAPPFNLATGGHSSTC